MPDCGNQDCDEAADDEFPLERRLPDQCTRHTAAGGNGQKPFAHVSIMPCAQGGWRIAADLSRWIKARVVRATQSGLAMGASSWFESPRFNALVWTTHHSLVDHQNRDAKMRRSTRSRRPAQARPRALLEWWATAVMTSVSPAGRRSRRSPRIGDSDADACTVHPRGCIGSNRPAIGGASSLPIGPRWARPRRIAQFFSQPPLEWAVSLAATIVLCAPPRGAPLPGPASRIPLVPGR
jgi:hypothetical protein